MTQLICYILLCGADTHKVFYIQSHTFVLKYRLRHSLLEVRLQKNKHNYPEEICQKNFEYD